MIRVKNNFKAVEREIEKRAEKFAHAVVSIGASWSKFYAPVAYSVLINSQKVDVTKSGGNIVGTVGFYVDYAKYLENGKDWKPRRPPKYGSEKRGITRANAWNKNARPGFLSYGFENSSAKSEIEEAKKIFRF